MAHHRKLSSNWLQWKGEFICFCYGRVSGFRHGFLGFSLSHPINNLSFLLCCLHLQAGFLHVVTKMAAVSPRLLCFLLNNCSPKRPSPSISAKSWGWFSLDLFGSHVTPQPLNHLLSTGEWTMLTGQTGGFLSPKKTWCGRWWWEVIHQLMWLKTEWGAGLPEEYQVLLLERRTVMGRQNQQLPLQQRFSIPQYTAVTWGNF